MHQTKELAQDKLVSAARRVLTNQGLAASSARIVAGLAGVSPSAVNYNFGSIEHLFGAVSTAALAETEAWMGARAAELAHFERSPRAASQALESLILEWAEGARELALIYQEILAAPESLAVQRAAWLSCWRGMFAQFAEHFELDADAGPLAHLFFQSEALYALSGWRPLLERAALRELTAHFASVWFGAPEQPPIGALATAEAAVRLSDLDPASEQAREFMDQAVAVVAQHGLGGLTHRAVAAASGVTAGAVAHYFRTADDLLAAAIRGQAIALLEDHRRAAAREAPAVSAQSIAGEMVKGVGRGPAQSTLKARRSLFLASLRSPGRIAAGATVRFAQGSTVAWGLRLCMPDGPRLNLDASVLSRLLSASAVAALDQPAECASDEAARVLKVFLGARATPGEEIA